MPQAKVGGRWPWSASFPAELEESQAGIATVMAAWQGQSAVPPALAGAAQLRATCNSSY